MALYQTGNKPLSDPMIIYVSLNLDFQNGMCKMFRCFSVNNGYRNLPYVFYHQFQYKIVSCWQCWATWYQNLNSLVGAIFWEICLCLDYLYRQYSDIDISNIYQENSLNLKTALKSLFCFKVKLMKVRSHMTFSGTKIDCINEIACYCTLAADLSIIIPANDSYCGHTHQVSTITTIMSHSPLHSSKANTM